ncbi:MULTISPECIES: divergent polysaccharide deacetylase family protein [Aminobacterium]|jgi:hypothetical protein|uniref:divergent polysaccharide deacetylase family protein n=1 Tax=Aminobacterium TaxID=81466 RepID=UPI00257D124A|nr:MULTISPECIES: divergent polysaccharide deacetylase family protein [unclassified Aminobacterium]
MTKKRVKRRPKGLFLLLFGGIALSVAILAMVGRSTPQQEHVEVSREPYPEIVCEEQKDRSTPPHHTTQPEPEPQAESCPLLAIVIDDFGYSYSLAQKVAAIDLPVTWAIIPYRPHSQETVKLAVSKGVPYLVHMPMEAIIDKGKGDFLIGVSMSAPAVKKAVQDVFQAFPEAVGMNNHRGSKATSDPHVMEAVMEALVPLGKVFIDSRTSAASVAYKTALKFQVPTAYNSVFLDHEKDIRFMREQFNRAVTIAKRRGWVVAICHNRPDTIPFLQELHDSEINDVKFVTVPELLGVQTAR